LYTPRELAHALTLADVELLIAARSFLKHDYPATLEAAGPIPTLREVVWLDAPADGAPVDLSPVVGATAVAPVAVGPGDDATIVFTSGSTADPKGAVHT